MSDEAPAREGWLHLMLLMRSADDAAARAGQGWADAVAQGDERLAEFFRRSQRELSGTAFEARRLLEAALTQPERFPEEAVP